MVDKYGSTVMMMRGIVKTTDSRLRFATGTVVYSNNLLSTPCVGDELETSDLLEAEVESHSSHEPHSGSGAMIVVCGRLWRLIIVPCPQKLRTGAD